MRIRSKVIEWLKELINDGIKTCPSYCYKCPFSTRTRRGKTCYFDGTKQVAKWDNITLLDYLLRRELKRTIYGQ